MAKQIDDFKTVELPGLPEFPKKRGRKPTGKAKSPSERMRDYRARKAQEIVVAKTAYRKTSLKSLFLTIEDSGNVTENQVSDFSKLAWLEIGRRFGWL